MYLALGTGAGLLLYWYAYGDHKSTKGLEEKAKKDEEEFKRKAVEATDAGKARAYDAYKQAESKYNDAKVCLMVLSSRHCLKYLRSELRTHV